MDRQSLYQKLLVSGEREQVKEFLRGQLTECGWKDQVRMKIRQVIEREGVDQVTVESITTEVLAASQDMVPETVRQAVFQRVQEALAAKGAKGNA